jgi:hypothetical protein
MDIKCESRIDIMLWKIDNIPILSIHNRDFYKLYFYIGMHMVIFIAYL